MKHTNYRKALKIDIDVEKEDWNTRYILLKNAFSFSWIKREVYRTAHGYHIIYDVDTAESLRREFGDDEVRLLLDNTRHAVKNVLFTTKFYVKNVEGKHIIVKRTGETPISPFHMVGE